MKVNDGRALGTTRLYFVEVRFTKVLFDQLTEDAVRSFLVRKQSIEKATEIVACPDALAESKYS